MSDGSNDTPSPAKPSRLLSLGEHAKGVRALDILERLLQENPYGSYGCLYCGCQPHTQHERSCAYAEGCHLLGKEPE